MTRRARTTRDRSGKLPSDVPVPGGGAGQRKSESDPLGKAFKPVAGPRGGHAAGVHGGLAPPELAERFITASIGSR